MKTIEYLAVIFAVCVIFSVFYWQVFHFVLLKQIRFQLFALRDDARRIAADHGIGESESFKLIERFICKTIRFSPSISLTSFVMFCAFYRKELAADAATKQELEKFDSEAPQELKSIKESTAKFSLLIMVFNSPWMVFIAMVGALVLLALGKISRIGVYRDAEKFVESVEPEPCASPQLA